MLINFRARPSWNHEIHLNGMEIKGYIGGPGKRSKWGCAKILRRKNKIIYRSNHFLLE